MIKIASNENTTECENCGETLTYEDSDIEYGAFGCGEILCPSCGEITIIENKSIELTANNIEYPKHFTNSTEGKKISDEVINNYIKEALVYMETHDDEYIIRGFGNMLILITREDSYCDIYVCENTVESCAKSNRKD